VKQYVPLKPVKRGFKVWAMAGASNGYMYDFSVYTGATGERETDLGEKVVLTLAESIKRENHQLYSDNYFTSIGRIKGENHQLYFDNYFTSISLLTKLLSQ
jgi:hypothetical protein